MKRISITFKITIWYTAFLVLLAGGLIALLLSAQTAQDRTRAERELVEIIADVSEQVAGNPDGFIYDTSIKYYEKETYISIYDKDGGLIVGRRPHSIDEFPELTDKTAAVISDTQGSDWYVYDSYLEPGGTGIWIRGMMRHAGQAASQRFLTRFLLIVVPVFIFLAVLGGLAITRRLFRPLRDIIRTTDQIRADGDLSKRIVPGNSRDELHELTCSINGMFETLETSMEREKQFSSDVSHELRTPVAVILSQSEVALEDPAYRGQALTVINRQARHMNSLIGRLLLLSQSDSGRIHPENEIIDMSALLRDIAEQQQMDAEDEDIEIRTDIADGVFVKADEVMLIRVVMNLISNAIKYGRTPVPEGHAPVSPAGVITISLREADGWAFCTVADQGMGIAPDKQARVWDRFYQVDRARTDSSSGSAGLGLAIVHSLTKAMGGQVSLKSEEGHGAAFTVSLPAAQPDRQEQ